MARIANTPPSRFTEATLKAVAKDLKSGRLPLKRTQISDEMVSGLRAMVNESGLISLHASYYVGGSRPYVLLGHLNEDSPDYVSIEDARYLTKVIKSLGEMGIDVQDGLTRRLMRELKANGTNWRPDGPKTTPAPKK